MIMSSLLLVFSGCVGSGINEEETSNSNNDDTDAEYTFEVANVLAEDDVSSEGLKKFAELAEEKSDGKIKIEIRHGGQLGSGIETFEAVENGNIDMAADSFANLKKLTNAFEVFHLPFIFESKQQAQNAFNDEEVKEEVDNELSEKSLKWFGSFDIGGPRVIGTANEKIDSFSDLSGLQFRASQSPLEIASQEAWDAKGVTVDWPETPESLDTGMVDGLTVPYASLYSAKLFEGGVVENVVDAPFQWYSSVTVVNSEKWEELPEDIQNNLEEAVEEAEDWHVDYVDDYVTENIEEMKEAGLEINEFSNEEYNKFKKETKDMVWEEYVDDETISEDMLDLILDKRGEVGEEGDWGYDVD